MFNVWVRDEPDPAHRNNSPADAVHPLSARVLLSATYAALGWTAPASSRFPGAIDFYGDLPGNGSRGMGSDDPMTAPMFDESCFEIETCEQIEKTCAEQNKCCNEVPFLCEDGAIPEDPELAFQRSVGVFVSVSQKGFRGFDLGARLVWEERFGGCQKPEGTSRDAVDALLARARKQNATVRDVVLALKDRLVAEPRLDPGEAELIEPLLDRPLAQPADMALEPGLRRLCGALLLTSPQHLLGGLPARGGEVPVLGPSSEDACRALAALPFANYAINCGPELVVERRAADTMVAATASSANARVLP